MRMMRFCGQTRKKEREMAGQRAVAVVGASTDPAKYGHKAVRAYRDEGWAVYPVHPQADAIAGVKAWPSLAAIPVTIDRVSLYLPPAKGLAVLADIAAVGPAEFYVNPGAESPELIRRAEELGLRPIQACSILAIGRQPD